MESETKEMRQGVGTGGNAAREGGHDACGGRSARSMGVRHEKCPFDFATDGDSADSDNKARGDLFLSFSTADAVNFCNELTRVFRLEADRLVGPMVALAEQNAIDLVRAVVAKSHTCKETFRGIAAEEQTERQRRNECR